MRKRKDVGIPGIGSGGRFGTRTHCSQGHLYTPETTWIRKGPSGGRRCRICDSDRAIQYQDRNKQKVIEAYGGKCCWPGCDITDPDMLVADHVNNDGVKDRKKPNGKSLLGSGIYRKIKQDGFPPKYQVLCANHNLKKELVRKRNLREKCGYAPMKNRQTRAAFAGTNG